VRAPLFLEICTALKCAEVQHIGNLLVLWRENPKDAAAEKSAPATRRKSEAMTKKQAAARSEARSRKG
jgi:hypothetical protein